MNINSLQKIAKRNDIQTIYSRAKEIGSIRLFKNDSDFSKLQTLYLYFLELYNVLYHDLSSGEQWITEEVINDPIRVEAYLLLRKENRELLKSDKNKKKKIVDSGLGNGSLIFKRGKSGK
jgi:hypothetical protein